MAIVTHEKKSVQAVLQDRPYLRWDLIPLASYLIEQGYSDGARTWILDGVAAGRSLPDLVASCDLEPADLGGALEAEAMGRRRSRRGTRRPVQTVGDLLNVLIGSLKACGVPIEEGSVDAEGLSVLVGGRPVALAIVRPVAGGAPEDFALLPPELEADEGELIEEWLDPHDGESFDAAEPVAATATLDVEPFHPGAGADLPPIRGGSPEEALLDEMRGWYRRNPIGEFNAIRTD